MNIIQCNSMRKDRIIKVIIVILILILIQVIFAISAIEEKFEDEMKISTFYPSGTRSYYFDNVLGDDSNNGTSSNSPKSSLSLIRHIDLSPGDKILLRRGRIFEKPMILSSSGSISNHIILDTYGKGNNPVIDLRNISNKDGITCWASNISIFNMTIVNAKQGLKGSNHLRGVYNIHVKNILVRNVSGSGVIFSNGGKNITIQNTSVDKAGNCGIALMGSYSRKLSEILVENCIVTNITYNDGITIHEADSTERTSAGENFTMKNNTCINCKEQGFDITSGRNVILINNTSKYNNAGGIVIGHSAEKVSVFSHYSENEPTHTVTGASLLIKKGDTRVENSIFKGGNYHTIMITPSPGYTNVSRVDLHNNYFGTKGNGNLLLVQEAGILNMTNNIFDVVKENMNPSIKYTRDDYKITNQNYFMDHNIYSYEKDFKFYDSEYGYFNFTRMRELTGQEANGHLESINLDFVEDGSYYFNGSSILIDNGMCTLQSEDMIGNPLYGQRDIGPIEYQPPFKIGMDPLIDLSSVRIYENGRFRYLSKPLLHDPSRLVINPIMEWAANEYGQIRSFCDLSINLRNKSGFSITQYQDIGNITYEVRNITKNTSAMIWKNDDIHLITRSDLDGLLSFIDSYSELRLDYRIEETNKPEYRWYETDGNPTTGDDFKVILSIQDDKGIDEVEIRYKIGNDIRYVSDEMNHEFGSLIDGLWSYNLEIPEKISGNLILEVTISDVEKNQIRLPREVYTILDDDKPWIVTDLTPSSVNSGDNLKISGVFADNRGLNGVQLILYSDGDLDTVEMVPRDGSYFYEIQISNETKGRIEYSFNISDSSFNYYVTETRAIEIVDIYPPAIIEDLSQQYAIDGNEFVFSFRAYDNHELGSGKTIFWFDDEEEQVVEMFKTNDIYGNMIYVQTMDMLNLHYQFEISDLSGNTYKSDVVSVEIKNGNNKTDSADDSSVPEIELIILDPFLATEVPGIIRIDFISSIDPTPFTIALMMDGCLVKYYHNIKEKPVKDDHYLLSYHLNTTDLESGQHILFIKAFDRFGNMMNETFLNISIDESESIEESVERIIIIPSHIVMKPDESIQLAYQVEFRNGEIRRNQDYPAIWKCYGNCGFIDENGIIHSLNPGYGYIICEISINGQKFNDTQYFNIQNESYDLNIEDDNENNCIVIAIVITCLTVIIFIGTVAVVRSISMKKRWK